MQQICDVTLVVRGCELSGLSFKNNLLGDLFLCLDTSLVLFNITTLERVLKVRLGSG